MIKNYFLLAFFISSGLYSQSECRTGELFRSSDFGDGKTQMAMPLVYEFVADSIYIHNDLPTKKKGDFAKMLIVKKNCDWQDQNNGQSVYLAKIVMDDRSLKEIPSRLEVQMENGKGTIKLKHYQMPEIYFSAAVVEQEEK